jgi:hypothetical protein
MKTALAGVFVATLALIAAPLQGQAVSADVVVRSGPVSGHVVLRDEYSSYQHPRRVVVVERLPRVIVVERMRRGHHAKHWKRYGYRPVVVYYVDGRYYDRRYVNLRGLHRVVVFERAGRFYRE